MPAKEASSTTAPFVWQTGTCLATKLNRRSTDAIVLPSTTSSVASATAADLTRVNSTPFALSTSGVPQQPCPSPLDSSITAAPPKPAPVDTLYPSPSGGFVPSPEQGQDWRLKPPPPGRYALDSSGTSRPTLVSRPARPPSLPISQDTASKIALAASDSASRRSSQASTSFASSRSASKRRASSTQRHKSTASNRSRMSESSAQPSERTSSVILDETSTMTLLPTVIIRDFAFDHEDARFSGKASTPSDELEQQRSQLIADIEQSKETDTFYADEDEDDEFGGDEGDVGHIVEGVYRVLYAFEPESEHELAVEPDETLHVIGSIEGGWAIAVKVTPTAQAQAQQQQQQQQSKGLVPATYLEYTGPLPEPM